jgi:hypothetical protein
MSAFDNATRFFHACETAQGWAGCKQYVAANASFTGQSEPMMGIDTVEAYCEWMADFGNNIVPGCSYDLHASAYDETNGTAIFFATFTGTHTGDAGPVPPTHQQTSSHYVYALTMDADDKVASMVKVWNASFALRELGWS